VKHQKLDDGRYNILLQGACRARIVREVASTPYRKAMLEPLETQTTMEIDLSDHRTRLESLLNDPLLKELSSVATVQNWISREIPTNALIDLTTMTVCDDVNERYQMLAEGSAESRAVWLERWLRSTKKTLRTAKRFEPPASNDRVNIN
jgi:Lon protease-like protein